MVSWPLLNVTHASLCCVSLWIAPHPKDFFFNLWYYALFLHLFLVLSSSSAAVTCLMLHTGMFSSLQILTYNHNYFKFWSNNSDISVITESNSCGYFIPANYFFQALEKENVPQILVEIQTSHTGQQILCGKCFCIWRWACLFWQPISEGLALTKLIRSWDVWDLWQWLTLAHRRLQIPLVMCWLLRMRLLPEVVVNACLPLGTVFSLHHSSERIPFLQLSQLCSAFIFTQQLLV